MLFESQMMQKKRSLLLVANFLSASGGSRSVMEDLAERFQELGYRSVSASHYRNGLKRGTHMVATALLRRSEYDVSVVDVYSGRAFMWAEGVCWALRLTGKPYILALRGGSLPAFAERWPARMRRLLGSAAVVTTPSRYLLEQMKHYSDYLHLLPNPLEIDSYEFRPRIQPRPQLTWLRSFHTMYNPTLAVRVLDALLPEFPDVKLTMIGPERGDHSLQEVESVASALGIRNHLELPGGIYKSQVASWLNRADIFLNTTNVDNTPVSVLEAMACGLCIVSTNVGGLTYLLEDEHDALLVPPNDPAAMAAAVRRVLTEPGLAERLSRNARHKAEEFDLSVILPQWERLIETVADGRAL
jgi:glycosyltransferase involved in cell wall biosynthesis